MKPSIVAILIFLLFTCNPGKDSYQLKLDELFFNAKTNAKYNSLINYFRKNSYLKEVEYQGWTSYPPLSALGISENKTVSTLFEFKNHPKISSQLKDGALTVRKIGAGDNALAALDISFGLISKAAAENLYDSIIQDFKKSATIKGETRTDDFRSIIFGKPGESPGIAITLFQKDIDSVHIVSITVAGQER